MRRGKAIPSMAGFESTRIALAQGRDSDRGWGPGCSETSPRPLAGEREARGLGR